MMVELSSQEKRVIDTLYAAEKPLTTQKVADNSEMAWATAKKYLLQLREKNIVTAGRHGKSTYWWLKTGEINGR